MTDFSMVFGLLLISACTVLIQAQDSPPLVHQDVFTKEFEAGTLEKCVEKLPSSAQLDVQWASSVKNWYVPYMNQRDVARGINLVWTGTGEDMCLILAPCRTFSVINETNGFYSHCNGAKSLVSNTQHRNPHHEKGLVDWSNLKFDGSKGWSGVSVIGHTDNRSYKVVLKCWEDGALGYTVFSARPRLPPPTLAKIKEFLDSVGFCPSQRMITYHSFACPRLY